MTVLIAASGGFIVVAVVVVLVLAVAYALYTREGSAINERPWDGSEGAPGAEGPDQVRGHETGDKSALGAGSEESALHQHGTDSHASERDAERDRSNGD